MNVQSLAQLGRLFFALAIAAFGILYLIYGQFAGGLPPVPPWILGGSVLAYVLGVALIVAAVGIAFGWQGRLAATFVGLLFVLCALLLHTLHARAVFYNAGERTAAFEALSLGCAALVLAAALHNEAPLLKRWGSAAGILAKIARYVFAFSMVVFGIQHFMYIAFIASLIPAWLHAPYFWSYFTGVAFIAAGLAIFTGWLARPAAMLLGLMFFLWVIILHSPRVAAAPRNLDEWTSLFIALGICGSSWILAGAMSKD